MRWTWRKASPEPDPATHHPPRPEEARRAREEAEAGLQDAKDQWGAVMAMAAALRRLRTENHFAEKVAETMRRRGEA